MAWSEAVTLVPPVTEPVALAAAKEFLQILEDDFDAQLEAFIAAAREQAEAVTGTRIMAQTVEVRADSWRDLDHLPIGPVKEVVSISYEDALGETQVLDPAAYILRASGLTGSILRTVNAEWPAHSPARGSIGVRLITGYDAAPRPLWTAILLMVADLFEHRGTTAPASVREVPTSMGVQQLLANYRIWL